MSNTQLLIDISSLPANLRQEVVDFVAFLKHKKTQKNTVKKRQFGYAKGYFKMTEDFDKPLDDFKEYM